MTFLRTISIRRRLWLILATALLCIVLTETKALFNVYQNMYTAEYTNKEDTVRSLVNSAHSLLERYYGLYRNGTLSEETAKQAALDSIRALKDGDIYFWINDSKPVLLMNASAPELEGQNMSDFTDKAGKYLFREIVKAGDANAAGGFVTYQWPRPGEMTASEKISFVRHFQPWDWYIGSGAYPKNIRAVFIENATGALLMTLVFVALMAVAIRMINTSIADPLTAISRAMKNIANGNGDLTQRTPVDGDDEISRLSRSFNQFVSQIHDIISESMTATGKVSSLGRDIASASSATRQLTDRQMQESEQVATGATEMSQTIQEIASNADKAAATVKTVESNARSGLHTMQKTQGHIADLASQIQSSRESIQSLREETESIGTVLDVIRGIAEQTNLLALNAAIEAARAGEQGRGFAVVADEVRTLASRTQESTEEIHRTISRLQDQAAATVSSMESSAAHSDETSAMSQQACDAIATISDAVVTLTEMNLSIASAVEQQSVAANEISRSINSIAESSGKINNNMSRADESGNMLEACSNNLSQLIARFKV